MKPEAKYLFVVLIFIITYNFYAQQIAFTRGSYFHAYKKTYIRYFVNGTMYNLPGSYYKGNVNHTMLLKYYIGYNVSSPDKARVYFDKPYFDSSKSKLDIGNTIGKIILIKNHFCVFQFMANKTNKEPVTARQAISNKALSNQSIKAGDCFKVQYLKDNPECAIICLDSMANDIPFIDYNKPFLSKPNGFACGFEANTFFTNPRDINQYLTTYGQPKFKSATPVFLYNIDYYHKSGIWYGAGFGGNTSILTGKFELGYLQKINRKFYIDLSTSIAGLSYTTGSFANNQLKIVADTSHFYYGSWYFNPKIDFMWRITKNNVWGCQFVKLGLGMYYNLIPDRQWEYDIGHEAPTSRGGKTTVYTYATHLNSMPPLSRYMFYISLSYSFNNFRKQ